jgi:hypothetical protein
MDSGLFHHSCTRFSGIIMIPEIELIDSAKKAVRMDDGIGTSGPCWTMV